MSDTIDKTIEQIEKLPDGGVEATAEGSYALRVIDLKALAASHTALLEAAKAVDADEPFGAARLRDAIEQAENE